jgi:hypothetical protein
MDIHEANARAWDYGKRSLEKTPRVPATPSPACGRGRG